MYQKLFQIQGELEECLQARNRCWKKVPRRITRV
jgi:hypothetical protein